MFILFIALLWFTFSSFTFSHFINKTDIRVHKPTSLNMVLIQEVEYKRDIRATSLRVTLTRFPVLRCTLIQVDIGTCAGYLLTDWNREHILDPCITLPAPLANILFTWTNDLHIPRKSKGYTWQYGLVVLCGTVGWDSIALWHCCLG